jgi:hypothetical protein
VPSTSSPAVLLFMTSMTSRGVQHGPSCSLPALITASSSFARVSWHAALATRTAVDDGAVAANAVVVDFAVSVISGMQWTRSIHCECNAVSGTCVTMCHRLQSPEYSIHQRQLLYDIMTARGCCRFISTSHKRQSNKHKALCTLCITKWNSKNIKVMTVT